MPNKEMLWVAEWCSSSPALVKLSQSHLGVSPGRLCLLFEPSFPYL